MNIKLEAALKYIDMGNYDKAIQNLTEAIAEEEEKGSEATAMEYRCVLGELYMGIGNSAGAREELTKVKQYAHETHTLEKQEEIASTYLDVLDGKIKMPEPAKRPGDIPLIPKPVQNRSFIAKKMNKRR